VGGDYPINLYDAGNKIGVVTEGTDLRVQINGSAQISGVKTLSTDTWYHVAVTRDGSDVVTLWVDGVSEGTATVTGTLGSTGGTLYIGSADTGNLFNGYLDEIRISDSARYTTTFTPSTTAFVADANTKLLIHSDFNGGLGQDSSGNKNDFTPTNLVATDQMIDTPTNNYCTLNPLFVSSMSNDGSTYSEGNLKVNDASSYYFVATGTQATPTSGKWYFETIATELTATHSHSGAGWSNVDYLQSPSDGPANTSNGYQYSTDGQKVINSTASSFGAAWAVDDVIGFALDLDNGFIYAAKNNTWQNSGDPTSGATGTGALGTSLSGNFIPFGYDGSSSVGLTEIFNFGQDSSFAGNKTAQGNGGDGEDFYYTPPTGYKALNTDNLPDPAIALPTDHFNTVLYSGNSSTQSITTVGFQPDFVTVKSRTNPEGWGNYDSVRGATERLEWYTSGAEATKTNGVTSFDSSGFSMGDLAGNNATGQNYASWNWKAGGAAATKAAGNIDGTNPTIASSVSANTTSGFSIVSYTGNGTDSATVEHGLSAKPELVIVKNLSRAAGWIVGSQYLTSSSYVIVLNVADAQYSSANKFSEDAPTASVVVLGDADETNKLSDSFVSYCFHSVEGYSKVGSYTGNNTTDNVMVYTGFRPAFVLIKCLPSATTNWGLFDDKREGYNVDNDQLQANDTAVESTTDFIDIVSNGFKVRSAHSDVGSGSEGYMYYAVASSPFKYSNAR
jgi:hypothetical protein